MYSEYYLKEKTGFNGNVEFVAGDLTEEGYIKIYKEECVKLYDSFSFKVYIAFVFQLFVVIINSYLLLKAYMLKEKFEKIKKEDEVLFDETQNVKY